MIKRVFDFFLASLGLMLCSPLIILAAIKIKTEDGGTIFFLQERVGRAGKSFHIIKFRTMREDNKGGLITVAGDQRITKSGRFFRKYKIDELPQLINIIKGEMSFVGPRPEVPRYVSMYSDLQQKVLDFIPGITDPASLKYRNENELLSRQEDSEEYYVQVIMPDKIAMNIEYAESANILSDIAMIYKTVVTSIQGR